VGVYRRHGKLDGSWRDCVIGITELVQGFHGQRGSGSAGAKHDRPSARIEVWHTAALEFRCYLSRGEVLDALLGLGDELSGSLRH